MIFLSPAKHGPRRDFQINLDGSQLVRTVGAMPPCYVQMSHHEYQGWYGQIKDGDKIP